MHNLLKAEFFKLSKSFTYKLMIGMYLLFEIWDHMKAVTKDILYTGVSYTGSERFFIMPAGTSYIEFMWIYAAVFVAGDFTNRNYAVSVVCGYPRRNIFGAKAVVYFVGMLPVMLIHAVVGPTVWSMYYGWGREWGSGTVLFMLKPLAYYLCSFAVFGSTYFFFAMLAKNRIGAVAMNLFLTQGIGSVIGNALMLLEDSVIRRLFEFLIQFSILQQVWDLRRGEHEMIYSFRLTFISSVAVTILMMLMATYIFCKHDMK
ncbi:MAG: hypothetical protein K2K54_11545 [Lachnospiraceae bacterium]|nr:hypothetical protein [Lachnospiraceae bacterium]